MFKFETFKMKLHHCRYYWDMHSMRKTKKMQNATINYIILYKYFINNLTVLHRPKVLLKLSNIRRLVFLIACIIIYLYQACRYNNIPFIKEFLEHQWHKHFVISRHFYLLPRIVEKWRTDFSRSMIAFIQSWCEVIRLEKKCENISTEKSLPLSLSFQFWDIDKARHSAFLLRKLSLDFLALGHAPVRS